MKTVATCLLLATLVTLSAGFLSACRDKPTQTVAPAPSAAPLALPDQLAPGELAEGTIDAFGLKLPRIMKVETRFPDAVFARGEASHKDLVNYVRDRVVATKVETLATKTVFDGATLKSTPANMLHIEVITMGVGGSKLVIRDETRPPAKPGLTEEERWREVGMTPHGEIIDPSHLN